MDCTQIETSRNHAVFFNTGRGHRAYKPTAAAACHKRPLEDGVCLVFCLDLSNTGALRSSLKGRGTKTIEKTKKTKANQRCEGQTSKNPWENKKKQQKKKLSDLCPPWPT